MRIRVLLFEAMAILLFGAIFSLIANACYPKGLSLAQNYFPSLEIKQSIVAVDQEKEERAIAQKIEKDDEVIQELAHLGLQTIDFTKTKQMFEDPFYQEGLYVLVDARDEKNYQEGHIPGAHQLDHYRLEQNIEHVLSICQMAIKIVVYCNGGECEDSQYVAMDLLDYGVDPNNLFVFIGGIERWKLENMPIAIGK